MPDPTPDAPAGAAADNSIDFEQALALLPDDENVPAAEQAPEQQAQGATRNDETAKDGPEPSDALTIEPENDAAPDETQSLKATDDAVVDLGEGVSLTVKELKDTYTAREELTRNLQETHKERGELKTLGSNMQGAIERIAGYLFSKIPPEPEPGLMYTNPGEHYAISQQRNSMIGEIQALLTVQEQAQGAVQQLSEADLRSAKIAEEDKLLRAMPSLKDAKRKEAFDRVLTARAKELGFPDEMITRTVDARLRQVFWESAKYREAIAKSAQVREKIESAPRTPASAPRPQHPNSQRALENVNAMKRLAKSGSLRDAVSIDFD